jgi:drug/metabolite transporter (DMT)-like permease
VTFILAIGAAVSYGIADFSGGYASKRLPPWGVMAWSQTLGVVALVAGLLVFPAEMVTSADISWGVFAGVGGAIGLGLLYRSLAEGTMSLVSPVAAATSAILPVIIDLATGGELSTLAVIGIVIALVAIVTIARERSHQRLNRRLLAMAIASGAGFGMFFVAIAQTAEASGFWPLVGARAATIPLGFLLHRLLEPPTRPRGVSVRWIAGAGLFDMSANLLIAAALQRGPLGIVSVLSSLYPAVTAMVAMAVLKERLSPTQVAGVGLAMIAVVLLVL